MLNSKCAVIESQRYFSPTVDDEIPNLFGTNLLEKQNYSRKLAL